MIKSQIQVHSAQYKITYMYIVTFKKLILDRSPRRSDKISKVGEK